MPRKHRRIYQRAALSIVVGGRRPYRGHSSNGYFARFLDRRCIDGDQSPAHAVRHFCRIIRA